MDLSQYIGAQVAVKRVCFSLVNGRQKRPRWVCQLTRSVIPIDCFRKERFEEKTTAFR